MKNTFFIHNNSSNATMIILEPEGFCFHLIPDEKISILDSSVIDPVTIRIDTNQTGACILSIWPGDGDVRVEKNGIDVFDII